MPRTPVKAFLETVGQNLGDWVFKKVAVDQVPNKIWELPTELRQSLNHPSKVTVQETKHPSP